MKTFRFFFFKASVLFQPHAGIPENTLLLKEGSDFFPPSKTEACTLHLLSQDSVPI